MSQATPTLPPQPGGRGARDADAYSPLATES